MEVDDIGGPEEDTASETKKRGEEGEHW